MIIYTHRCLGVPTAQSTAPMPTVSPMLIVTTGHFNRRITSYTARAIYKTDKEGEAYVSETNWRGICKKKSGGCLFICSLPGLIFAPGTLKYMVMGFSSLCLQQQKNNSERIKYLKKMCRLEY